MENKVSIIIPVYNVEKYLEQCVNSILAQTYKNLEIILVDDGSPDNCPQICDDFAAKDQRIKVIHKKNGGLSSARNAGLDVATGEYVMFIDSDDFIDNNTVEELLAVKENCNADIVCYGMYHKHNDNISIIKNTVSKNNIEIYDNFTALRRLLMRTIDCSSCNKLYSKEIIGDSRFKEGRNNEDNPFLFELYQKHANIAYTNKVYYYYRHTQGSISKTFNDRSFDIIKNIEDIEKEIETKKLNLNKEFKFYKTNIFIIIALAIQSSNNKKKYIIQYNELLKYIKQNFGYILLNSKIKLKIKISTILTIFNLYEKVYFFLHRNN